MAYKKKEITNPKTITQSLKEGESNRFGIEDEFDVLVKDDFDYFINNIRLIGIKGSVMNLTDTQYRFLKHKVQKC